MSGGKTVFELRVHGVSGTPPEAMLHCPAEFLKLEKGDRDAAFYRRAGWIDDAASPPESGRWRRRMETYSWGGLTSRRASRALWLLLLPFSLINLAHWMLPPTDRTRSAAVVVTTLRLIALSFTLSVLLAMAVAVLDVAVWQCANIEYCSSGWGPLAYLAERSGGVRLAAGALPLVAVILLLWLFGREETSAPGVEEKDLPPRAVVPVNRESPLANENFWNPDASVRRMRACHVIAWTAGLGALVLAPAVKYTHTGAAGTVNVALLAANAVLLAVAVGATARTRVTGRGGKPAGEWTHGVLMALRWMALAVLAVTLGWVAGWGEVPDHPAATFLPGVRAATYGLVTAQLVLLMVTFAGTALALRGTRADSGQGRHYRMTLKGYTGPFVALLGWLLGGALSVGVGVWAAQILGTLRFTSDSVKGELLRRSATLVNANGDFEKKLDTMNSPAPLLVPVSYLWTSASLALLIVVAAISLAWLWRRSSRVRGPDDRCQIERDADTALWDRVAASRALARLPDAGPALIAVLAVLGLTLFAMCGVLYTAFPHLVPEDSLLIAALLGTPVVLVVALVVLVVQGFRNRQVRRLVAIMWDVVTFWPRSTHPLTPPSYGGRTVLDLRIRMAELTRSSPDGTPSTRVVLVAHSQGTIIAAATLLQCKEPQEIYPLLTFGSPLRRLYARNFPAYFGYPAMSGLARTLSWPERRWINLWAHTDPIGGWVFDPSFVYFRDKDATSTMSDALAGVDCRILDVPQRDPATNEFGLRDRPICGHGGFWDRTEYTDAVDALQELVVPSDEGRVTSATAPPLSQAM